MLGAPKKREIIISLKTSDETEALTRFAAAKSNAEFDIKCMKEGTYQSDTPDKDFAYYQKRALSQGRTLVSFNQAIQDPAEIEKMAELLKSKEKVTKDFFNSHVCLADNDLKILELPSFYEKVNGYSLKDLNKREYNRKIAPLNNACKKLVQHLGKNKAISEVTRADAKSFLNELKKLTLDRVISANTANKYLVHMRVLIKCYYKEQDIEKDTAFCKLHLKEDENQRSPLTVEFVKTHWLNTGVLNNLNPELKYLVFAMIDTGCNFKELCGLDPTTDIKLNDEFPHIILQDNKNRKLKTKFRDRKIPLVGFALEAFKHLPNGFQRYSRADPSQNESRGLCKAVRFRWRFTSRSCTKIWCQRGKRQSLAKPTA